MKFAVPALVFVTLAAAIACGDDGDSGPKFIGEGSGGRRASGGSSSSGGRVSTGGRSSGGARSGGETGSGGSGETDGGDGGSGGSSGSGGTIGSGGAAESGGVAGAGGGIVVKPECHLTTTNEICDGCVHDLCSFQCADCEGNADCASIVECIFTDCGSLTSACINTCRSQFPDGDAAFRTLVLDCGRASCSTFCPFNPR